jgi:subtilisin family serine protease
MTGQTGRGWRLSLALGFAVWGAAWGLGLVAPAGAVAQTPVVPSHLVQRAAAAGSVRVIVQVGVTAGPEAMLAGDQAVAAQRHLIGSAQSLVLSRLSSLGHRALHQYTTVPFLAVEGGPDVLRALESLRGLVVSVEEDQLHRPVLAESGPLVQAPTAWGAGFDGTGQVVAILDTGVDKFHSFLAGKVVEEACFSANGNCPNLGTVQIGPGAGVPCTYAPSDCQHGTHVAGIAAGRGTTFSGVARGAQIMAVQVFSRIDSVFTCGGPPTCALAFTSDILAGLDRVNDIRGTRNFASVNMSLGGGTPTAGCDSSNFAMKAMIDSLRAAGIATVIASGNNGATAGLSSPACISTAISVGSTTDGGFGGTPVDRVSSFSNSAFTLSLLAPGQVTTSSVPGGAFANFQGTSMATPHVAGAWAVLKQVNPSATVSQILTTLQNTGVPVVDFRNGLTKRRIRLFDAIGGMIPPNACSTTATNFETGDYDGDGRSDIVLYRTSTGVWNIRRSSTSTLQQVPWGAPMLADLPVPGNYTEGGALPRTDVAVYRPGSGEWFIRRVTNGTLFQLAWGAPSLGDTPAVGDYDGDGRFDIAVYRRATGQWFIRRSTDGALFQLAWGAPTLNDVPVPGDYDGDGKTDIAVYRRSNGQWLIRRSTDATLMLVAWGAPVLDDVPVPGNYTEAGVTARTDIAVYRRSTGVWYIRRATDAGLTQLPWGAPTLGDVAAQGDFDGDGRTDVAIYRTRTGEWFIRRSSDTALVQVSWGSPALGDKPPGCR